MFLLRFIKRILGCDQDDEEHIDYRNYGNYSSFNSPNLPIRSITPNRWKTSIDSPQQHRFRDDARDFTPTRSLLDSKVNFNSTPKFFSTDSSEKAAAATPFSHSSSIRAPSIPPPSSKPSLSSFSSTISNVSVSRAPIGAEKPIQTTNDCCKSSPMSKIQPPSISSSAAPILSSKSPSTTTISSTNRIPAVENPVGPATKPPDISRVETSLLSKSSLIYASPSTMDCKSLSPQSVASSSEKLPPATLSSKTSSITGAPSRVWQPKIQIPLDSTTLVVETTYSRSPSLLNNDSVSLATPLNPSPAPNSIANSSFYGDRSGVWRKKKIPSTLPSRETERNVCSLTSVKVPTPNSSSSEASSPSSLGSSPLISQEARISNRRVLSKYQIPKYLEEMIKKDIVPPVLKCPLSPSTYCDYFSTLLSAEDFYLEKWSKYLLENVSLELRPRINSAYSQENNMKRKKTMFVPNDFVSFKIDAVPEKRPYLLSRDFVFLQPLNADSSVKKFVEPFKGILFRVIKSVILVEFEDDFHSQHSPSKRYNVSFSFNRVCLKRAHQAISVASDPSFHSILFPDQIPSPQLNSFDLHEKPLGIQDPVTMIVNHKGPIPYLIEGNLSVVKGRSTYQDDEDIYHGKIHLTSTGRVIERAILSIYRANPCCRILVCSPTNNTSDELLRSLRVILPEASFFRANAAFRDYNLVPDDIVHASLYEEEEEYFACPSHAELLNFNVITCTFISSFRLYSAGIDSEHFSHIFLVDACLAIEPEAIVPLANLAGKNTVVVVAGSSGKSPGWVRSEIARKYGLKMSYFNRLLRCEPYWSGDAKFIAKISY